MGPSLQFPNQDPGAAHTSQTDLRDELQELQAKVDGLIEAVAMRARLLKEQLGKQCDGRRARAVQ